MVVIAILAKPQYASVFPETHLHYRIFYVIILVFDNSDVRPARSAAGQGPVRFRAVNPVRSGRKQQ